MAAGAQLDKTNANAATENPAGLQMTGRPSAGSPAGAGRSISEQLNDSWNSGRLRWQQMAPRQRYWAAVVVVMLVLTVVGLIWISTRTEWRTLYAGLDPEDSRQMGQLLTQAQITFDLSANGTAIRVPVAQLDKARLATAAKGGPRSGRMGFELFDKPNWVGSEFDERVNYQRALEGELEHTVATLADVQSARVHLVLPHESLFRDQERPAKASVVLTLRHRSLADGEDEAIRNLVASAVDGLQPSQVALVDASGHVPLGPRSGEALRLGTEQALEAKLIETLEPVTGAGNVRASVTVDYDPTSSDVTEETYDPDQTVTLTMQRTEQATGAQQIPGGVPGTATNAPNSQALPVYPQQVTSPQNAKSESGTYGASRTVRHTTQGPGHIRRLTAAIIVNDRLAPESANQKTKQVTWQPRTVEELHTLTTLAQAAVGYDSGRGDLVTVQDLAFDENRHGTSPTPLLQALAMVERSPMLVKYGTLLAALLLITLLVIRPGLKHLKTAGSVMSKQKELGAPAEQVALTSLETPEDVAERKRVQQVFDQVTETLKRDPAQSSRLLQSWIHSD